MKETKRVKPLTKKQLGKGKKVVLLLDFFTAAEKDTNLPCPPYQLIFEHSYATVIKREVS